MKKMITIIICILLTFSIFGCKNIDTFSIKKTDDSSNDIELNTESNLSDDRAITVTKNISPDKYKSITKQMNDNSSNETQVLPQKVDSSDKKKTDISTEESAGKSTEDYHSDPIKEIVQTTEISEGTTESVPECTTETTTEALAETTTETTTEAISEQDTEQATETFVSYSPGNVVAIATAKCQSGGMITTTDNLANLLAEGKITEDEYNEYYPYDGLGYYSVFVETDLNAASTTSGRKLGSEQGIADYIADMLLLEREPYFLIEYGGESSGFYEFRCYR